MKAKRLVFEVDLGIVNNIGAENNLEKLANVAETSVQLGERKVALTRSSLLSLNGANSRVNTHIRYVCTRFSTTSGIPPGGGGLQECGLEREKSRCRNFSPCPYNFSLP